MPHSHAILWSLATIVASSGLVACDAPDDELDVEALALEDGEDEDEAAPDALADGALAQDELDELLVQGIAVEDGLRLRDVIHLLPADAVPADADLDQPLVADPQTDVFAPEIEDDATAAFDGPDGLAADIDPLAIGEPQCATTSIASATNGEQVAMSPESPQCGEHFNGSVSPNASYNPAGCPNQYITEVTGTQNREFDFYWDWRGSALNSDTCELAHVFVTAYGRYYSVSWNGTYYVISIVWDKLGTEGRSGDWVSGPFFSLCTWDLDQGTAPLPHMNAAHGYNRIRLASQGVVFAIWPIKQRIEAGVKHGEFCIP